MNKFVWSLFISTVAISARAESVGSQVIKALVKALPPSPVAYVGKNNSRPCSVKIDALPGFLYVVTVAQHTKYKQLRWL